MEPNELQPFTPDDSDAPVNEGPVSQSSLDNSTPVVNADGSVPPPPNATGPQVRRGMRNWYKKHKRTSFLAGGAIAIIGVTLVGFILLLPLKAVHFLKIIEQKSYARMEDTVQVRTDKLLDKYIQKKLEQSGAKSWGVNHTSPIVSGHLLQDLYRNWATGNFEKNLTEQTGVSFQRLANGRYNVLQNGKVLNIDINGTGNTVALENITNNQFKNVLDASVEQNTKWFQILKRRQLRLALYQKYSVKRWWFFQKPLQAVQDKRLAIKRAIQRQLNDWVIRPVSGKLADYFDCLIKDTCANVSNNNDINTQVADEITNAADNAVNQEGVNTAATVAEDEAETAAADSAAGSVAGVVTFGYQALEYSNKIATAVKPGGKLEQILKARNYLGWASFFSANGVAINQIMAGEAVNGPSIGPGATTAASTATSAKVNVSPLRNFANNAREFVAAATPLNTNYTNVDAYNEQLGNPAQSRVYEKYYAGEPDSKQSPKKCDGKALPQGQVVCPNQKAVPPSVAELRQLPFMDVIFLLSDAFKQIPSSITSLIDKITSAPGDAVNWVLQNTGIQSAINSVIGGTLDSAVKAAIGAFFGPGVNALATNGDWFDNMQAGADVTANATMQSSMGGQLLTADQQQAWATKLQNEELAREDGWHGIAYKVASTDSPTSLFGRLIAWSPSKLQEVPPKMVSFITAVLNPNTFLSGAITVGNAVTPGAHVAFADVPQYQNPFGIDSFGYAVNDPHLNQDPEITASQCAPGSESRQAIDKAYQDAVNAYNQDPSGHPLTVTDWCLLEDSAINENQSYFTKEDDGGLKTAISPSGGAQISGPVNCDPASGTVGNAKIACEAKQLLDIPYENSGVDPAYFGHAPQQWWEQHLAGNPKYNFLDCSGLTSVAVWLAFGNLNPSLNKDYCSATYLHDGNFSQISLSAIQPGDLVIRNNICGPQGHVAVVETVNQPSNQMTVAEAYTHKAPSAIRPHAINGGGFDYAARYIGPGSSSL